jgi:hypothetical protein
LSDPGTPVTILVCACGKRLNAAGAVPGRVGHCPACGARLQVPGGAPPSKPPPKRPPAAPADPGDEVLPPRAPVGPSAFVSVKGRGTGSAGDTPRRPRERDGLILAPAQAETRLRDSLLYPFWGGTGVSLLVFLPPMLWFTSLPLISVAGAIVSESMSPTLRFGLLFLSPILGLFLPLLGYTLLLLGRVLVTSSLGEVEHPRWPPWNLAEMASGAWRWIWGIAAGAALGGFPALVYWITCGDIDPFDLIIFVELLALGAVYAQMAVLASILHDDPLGANPVTVVLGIVHLGWSYVVPCLVTGIAAALGIGASVGVMMIPHPLLAAVGLWGLWVWLLYLSMVALRVLGLCYHRHSRAMGWFRDRPRWGS